MKWGGITVHQRTKIHMASHVLPSALYTALRFSRDESDVLLPKSRIPSPLPANDQALNLVEVMINGHVCREDVQAF